MNVETELTNERIILLNSMVSRATIARARYVTSTEALLGTKSWTKVRVPGKRPII